LEALPVNRIAVLFLTLVALLPTAQAEGDDIAFAVPSSGRITLGVFDTTGKLVRTLHTMDEEDAFRVGLNGYITKWDGLDDAGNRAPAGHYHVRGYLIEDVTVDGVAYHFNDWMTDDDDPSLRHIVDFAFLPGGDVLLLAISADGSLLATRYSPESGFVWVRVVDPSPASDTGKLTTNPTTAFIQQAGSWILLDINTGTPLATPAPLPSQDPIAIAALSSTLFTSLEKTITPFSLPSIQAQPSISAPTTLISFDADNGILAGCGDGSVWISEDLKTFQTLPISARCVSIGAERTFWYISTTGTGAVAQAHFNGEILRELEREPNSPQPQKIQASRTSDTFAVLETAPDQERLRVISRNPNGEWTVEWEKSIRESKSFGYVESSVSAQAPETPHLDSLRFRLEENPLTGEKQELTLRVVFDEEGTQLSTPDGLPLVTISTRSAINRVVMRRGETPNSIHLLQGDGATVEEFHIHGLDKIIPLNAGGIDIGDPPGHSRDESPIGG
jgi:hypothetical protein